MFTDIHEQQLVDYIKHAASIYFGLCSMDIRQLAYQCGKAYGIVIPESWCDVERARANWFTGFLKRHPDLSIRKPEATSMNRANAFNRVSVGLFFDKLTDVMNQHKFQP